MKNGFTFGLYEMLFENCFIHSSRYSNGNLQLSLFGTDPTLNQTAHFADITLNQNKIILNDDEIIVDCTYKPNFIEQLKDLRILKEQTGIFPQNNCLYPIYRIDLSRVTEKQYCMQELVAA